MDTHQATCINHSQLAKYARTRRDGVSTYKHRLVYIDTHGLRLEDIADRVVRHRCDNPGCLNPDHLELGTQADNSRDMWERTRVITHRKNYAAISAEYVRGSVEFGQVALAKKYGLSQGQVSKIIRGDFMTVARGINNTD